MLSRRAFIATVAATAPALAAPARASARVGPARLLSFNHLHTGERLVVEYFSDGAYLPDALGSIDYVLRDFRTNQIHAIDRQLLDLLHALSQSTGSRMPFQVISGYRSPATNQLLRSRSEGVAVHSLHMEGQAIDVRLPDVPLRTLRDAARALGRGGVGYYPGSNFVHVDTGRVRVW
jgi:uncharacterized protein YcbK (DUF882 family)